MEYRRPLHKEDATRPGALDWDSFGACINPGRDYQAFNRLSGVRGPEDGALIAPRGIAPGLGYEAANDLLLRVKESELGETTVNWEDRYVTPAHAEDWIRGGSSFAVERYNQRCVTHPDYHTHSWLTLGEYLGVLVDLKTRGCDVAVEYWALAGALSAFDQRGFETRLVFWFDN